MATFDDVRKKISELPEKVRKFAPTIIAETATEYFKERFEEKSWEGQTWQNVKRDPGVGSLMLRTGQLQASIRPTVVTPDEVVISGGSPSVPYAQIHNEGGTIKQIPTAKQRRFLWAMHYKEAGDGGEMTGFGRAATSKELNIAIPKRQFMGDSPTLNRLILEKLTLLIKE